MKKIFLIAAIAVAGVAAWAASNTNALKAEDAEATKCEYKCDGRWIECGFSFHDWCQGGDDFYCHWAKYKLN